MAFDERLANRVRRALAGTTRVAEPTMFGGLAFMVDGKMALGVLGEELMVRVSPDAHEAALEEPGARPMDFTGRPMRGFIFVGPEGYRGAELVRWIEGALAYNQVAPRRDRKRRR